MPCRALLPREWHNERRDDITDICLFFYAQGKISPTRLQRIKKVGREHRIPFELSVDPFYSESNMKYLDGIMQNIEAGKVHFAEHELIEED